MFIGIGMGVGLSGNSIGKKIIVRDSFNRANSSTTIGNADTGQAWVALPNPWGISSNQAYSVDTTTTDNAYINAGKSDVIASVIITFSTNEGLILRVLDLNNHIIVRINPTGLGVFRLQAGSPVSIGNYAFTPVVSQVYTLKAICKGSSINVFLDGILRISAVETFAQTNTIFGIRAGQSTSGRFDDFLVEG